MTGSRWAIPWRGRLTCDLWGVLFRLEELERIRAGEITRTYRRWRSPRAKAGSTQRTRLGVLAIDAVDRVDARSISDADAQAAGSQSRAALLKRLAGREGDVYRIDLSWAGADPRVELRRRRATGEELAGLVARLERIDARSPRGPWTWELLELIRDNEGVRAVELAGGIGRDKLPFKRDVRKLKELGLTESLEVGYRLSPRGRALLGDRAQATAGLPGQRP